MTEKFKSSAGASPEKPPAIKKVAALNDQLRKTFQGGQVMMTRGIQSLGEEMLFKFFVMCGQIRTHGMLCWPQTTF